LGQTGVTKAWKSGYAHGYLGYDLNGTHTKLFFWGYANGTLDLWRNKGYACGWSAWKCHAPDYDNGKVGDEFHNNNLTGWIDRVTAQNPWRGNGWNQDSLNSNILNDTALRNSNDHNWQNFIGFHNGYKVEGDQNDNEHGARIYYITTWECPSGNTKEYCAGYAAGWNHAHTEDMRD
jgi:hypothetical protein